MIGCLYSRAYVTNDELGYNQNWTVSNNLNESDSGVTEKVFLRQCVITGYHFDTFDTFEPKVYFIRKLTAYVSSRLQISKDPYYNFGHYSDFHTGSSRLDVATDLP